MGDELLITGGVLFAVGTILLLVAFVWGARVWRKKEKVYDRVDDSSSKKTAEMSSVADGSEFY